MGMEHVFEYLGIEPENYEAYLNDEKFMEELANVSDTANCFDMEYCLRGDEFRFDMGSCIETANFVIFQPLH